MNRCDSKYKDMLHAYELGMLGDDEIRELELHLMECEVCFNALREFKNEAELMRQNQALAKIADEADSEDAAEKKNPKSIIRYVLSVAAVLLILLLKPWNLSFHSGDELIASENKLLVMPFENLTQPDDTTTVKIIHNLLVTDLGQSKYLRVTPASYTVALINEKKIDQNDLAAITSIGKYTHSILAVRGNIVQIKPNFIFSADVIEVADGQLIGSVHQISREGASIFEAIDSLTVKIKANLELDIDFSTDNDLSIASVTTGSSEAYHHYLLGVEAFQQYYIPDAVRFFQKALEYDNNFAMAMYYLSRTKSEAYIDSAYALIDNVGELEKYYIRARYDIIHDSLDQGLDQLRWITKHYPDEQDAYYIIGRFEYYQANFAEAVEALKKSLSIDNKYKPAYNLLTYCYNMLDDYDNAIITINKYIELYPDEANPYDTRGDLYSFFGELEKAKESYRIALDIRPDFYSSLMFLSYMYLYQNDYKAADSCITALANSRSPQMINASKLYHPYLAIRQGELRVALDEINHTIEKSLADGKNPRGVFYSMQHQAIVLDGMGKKEDALAVMKNVVDSYRKVVPNDSVGFVSYYATLLYQQGNISEIQMLRDQVKPYQEENNVGLFSYNYLEGLIALANKEYGSAEQSFIKSVEKLIEKNAYGYFLGYTMLARAYRADGQIAEAIEVLEKLNKIYTSRRLYYSPIDIENYYLLGRLYEDSHWNQKAIEQYQLVLTHWGTNDSKIEFVEDARQRLEKLQNL